MSKVHEIHTSCGHVFRVTVEEMSDRQLTGMIAQNPDSEALPQMQAELLRRQQSRTTPAAARAA
jgi:hypothetical protein